VIRWFARFASRRASLRSTTMRPGEQMRVVRRFQCGTQIWSTGSHRFLFTLPTAERGIYLASTTGSRTRDAALDPQ
jgi:hypothetical protein